MTAGRRTATHSFRSDGCCGLPASLAAWLTTTARRKALDRLRHTRIIEKKAGSLALLVRLEQEIQSAEHGRELSPVPDDQLRLIFICCHPALSREAQVALTLRTLAGLSIAEIARAFLVSEAAIAQRLARAKQKIARANIPYEIPDRESLAPRLDAVLSVLHLVFNEGYLATAGRQLVRDDLVADALRLARGLAALLPDEPEPLGLLKMTGFSWSPTAPTTRPSIRSARRRSHARTRRRENSP